MTARQVAIACQGGGSLAAFTAGVLKRLFEKGTHKTYHISGLSGTSSGAVSALLAWYGLMKEANQQPEHASDRLMAFWKDNSATLSWEKAWNSWVVNLMRLQEGDIFPNLRVSPYNIPLSWVLNTLTEQAPRKEFLDLKELLAKYIVFDEIYSLRKPSNPRLLLGSVNVLSGEFKAFDSFKDEISMDAVLAAAAVPTFSRAVQVGRGMYWDSLFSQNPPISPFFEQVHVTEKPDEVWIIQIHPLRRRAVPHAIGDIIDRRDELSGNLSLYQELKFIQTVNRWINKGFTLSHKKHLKPVTLRRIAMDDTFFESLDSVSRFDRRPSFIDSLIAHGEHQADSFLRDPDNHIFAL